MAVEADRNVVYLVSTNTNTYNIHDKCRTSCIKLEYSS